ATGTNQPLRDAMLINFQRAWIATALTTISVVLYSLLGPATGQAVVSTNQTDAIRSYDEAVSRFKTVLRQRGSQIDAKQPLPDLPGQALYLARNDMLSAYKDLTDTLPSRIGRPNKFKIPPAYFDAENEPLLDEYVNLFTIMQAPPANAQMSET